MDIALLLLDVDRAPDLGILSLPRLEAFDLGRMYVLSGSLAVSRSSSPLSSCLTNSPSEAGESIISSSSSTMGIDGCQSPVATAVR
eukprot:3286031-Pyramimonas_sp.AAC.1